MFRQLIISKKPGNITSIIIGQMILMVLIIWFLFSLKTNMLNTTFNYIDDALVNSALGGALANIEEYGKSNQLVMHENDVYTVVNYTDWEKKILLSEMNYESDVLFEESDLLNKNILDKSSRKNWVSDKYLRRSLSAFLGNLTYNISNGHSTYDVDVENIMGDIDSYLNNKAITISSTALSEYIVSDIQVTRLEVYNVYKSTLAEKHIYHSDYLLYNGSSTPNKDVSESQITWNTDLPDTEQEFINMYMPHPYVLNVTQGLNTVITESNYTSTPNEDYTEQLAAYEKNFNVWKADLEFYNECKNDTSKHLICYTNTNTTYQGKYNKDKAVFEYLYSSNGDFNVNYTHNAVKASDGVKAPIAAWSVMSYKSNYGGTGTTSFNYNETDITTGTNDEIIVTNVPKIVGGKLDGTELENSSIYVELTFTVSTFPSIIGDMDNTKVVTVARLIDLDVVEQND